jgi:hypothetical protein
MTGPNPFVALECVHEHVESAWTALAREAGIDPREFRRQEPVFGTAAYHLKAATEAVSRLYQQLAVMLPGARALDEGDVTDTILDQLDD